jgi:amidophosphoribosyltransferase
LYPCKFINFSRSKNEYDLVTRRYIREKEGENADVEKYTNPEGESYKEMVEYIRKKLNLTTLAFQHIDDLIHAIGLPAEQLCTYCFTGKDYTINGECYQCPCKSGECPCHSDKHKE